MIGIHASPSRSRPTGRRLPRRRLLPRAHRRTDRARSCNPPPPDRRVGGVLSRRRRVSIRHLQRRTESPGTVFPGYRTEHARRPRRRRTPHRRPGRARLRNHLIGVTPTSITVGRAATSDRHPAPASGDGSIQAIREFRVPGAQLTSTGGQPILDRIASLTEDQSRRQRSTIATGRVPTTVRASSTASVSKPGEPAGPRKLRQLELPPGYQAQIAGIHQVIDDSVQELGWAFSPPSPWIYAVMATQFESIGQPSSSW